MTLADAIEITTPPEVQGRRTRASAADAYALADALRQADRLVDFVARDGTVGSLMDEPFTLRDLGFISRQVRGIADATFDRKPAQNGTNQ